MRLELEDDSYVRLARERPIGIGNTISRFGYALTVCERDGSRLKRGRRTYYSRQEYQVDQAMRRGIPLSLMLGRVLDAD